MFALRHHSGRIAKNGGTEVTMRKCQDHGTKLTSQGTLVRGRFFNAECLNCKAIVALNKRRSDKKEIIQTCRQRRTIREIKQFGLFAILLMILIGPITPTASAQEVEGVGPDVPSETAESLPAVPELAIWMVEWRIESGTGTFNQEGKTVYFTSDGSPNGINMLDAQEFYSAEGVYLGLTTLYFRFVLHDGTKGYGSTDERLYMYNVARLEVQLEPFKRQYK
jgi:hypothetical protein